jgi:hypothetical protein
LTSDGMFITIEHMFQIVKEMVSLLRRGLGYNSDYRGQL